MFSRVPHNKLSLWIRKLLSVSTNVRYESQSSLIFSLTCHKKINKKLASSLQCVPFENYFFSGLSTCQISAKINRASLLMCHWSPFKRLLHTRHWLFPGKKGSRPCWFISIPIGIIVPIETISWPNIPRTCRIFSTIHAFLCCRTHYKVSYIGTLNAYLEIIELENGIPVNGFYFWNLILQTAAHLIQITSLKLMHSFIAISLHFCMTFLWWRIALYQKYLC